MMANPNPDYGRLPKDYTGLPCDDCGELTGTECFCPYAQEIHEVDEDAVLCNNCYHERCMDI